MTTFLSDRTYAPEQLGRVLILGTGVTGQAVLEYIEPLVGTRVDAVEVAQGDDPLDGHFDLCIASPGISQFSDLYQAALAASDELIGEVEFAWCESAAHSRWIAITGTNGKTTTTALTAHLLEACGYTVRCVGNIGDAAITAVGQDIHETQSCFSEESALSGNGSVSLPGNSDSHKMPPGYFDSCGISIGIPSPSPKADGTKRSSQDERLVYVVETSSYQLASTRRFAPDVAVVLNITPDHLAWHQSHENYAQAKWKILANLQDAHNGVAVLNATNDEVRAGIRALKDDPQRGFDYIPLGTAQGIEGDMRSVCGAQNAAFLRDDGSLVIAFDDVEYILCQRSDLLLEGSHNTENALAAASAAVAIGAPSEGIAQALTSFAPLPHRIEPVGTVRGVRFYNDSKATNTDATLKAITAFMPEKPVILLGGRDKGTDLTELVETCVASSNGVVLYGESLNRFAAAFDAVTQIPVLQAPHMADAFMLALEWVQPGAIVLLSPACASFDEFSCFEERGDVFKEMVVKARDRLGA